MTSQNAAPARSWYLDRPLTGFALPQGRFARLFGWVMANSNHAEQREVFDALGVRPGERVLEVGHGPGVLLRMLAEAGAVVCGVDPSEAMVRMAARRLRRIGDGRADVRVGVAERTGHPDASFDAVVSVNNVPMWSDLDAGFAELHRVLRPGGRLVVAWHGGRSPRKAARHLVLPEQVLDQILDRMRQVFGTAERKSLQHVEVFTAHR